MADDGDHWPDTISDLIERRRIEDVLIRYATALDLRDWELLRSCFSDDAIADYGADLGHYEGIEAIITACRQPLSGLDASQHLLGNIVIELDGDRATASSYVHAQHVLANDQGEPTSTIGGRYVDELVRFPEGWRITKLRLEISWRTGNAAVLTLARERGERSRRVS